MKKLEIRMAVFVVLLVVSSTLAVMTYFSHHYSNPIMIFLAAQHIPLMLVLIFISIGFGHTWASTLQHRLRQEQKDSKQLLSVLKDLLNGHEQMVIQLLVENGGKISQNDIAKREKMTRVKAHRTIQALESRGVVHTERIGKRVYVHLDAPILEKLR